LVTTTAVGRMTNSLDRQKREQRDLRSLPTIRNFVGHTIFRMKADVYRIAISVITFIINLLRQYEDWARMCFQNAKVTHLSIWRSRHSYLNKAIQKEESHET
jgi:hypothetical protein